jgi:putative intracellular protease/amidase
MWDLVKDAHSIALIEGFYNTQKPVAFVCHAPAALLKVKAGNGHPLVKAKKVTGFSDTEEEAVGLINVVPFLLEDELEKLGAHYSKWTDWSSYTQQDDL